MGSIEIIHEIERDARSEAGEITRQAEEQAGEITDKARKEAVAIMESGEAKAKIEAVRIENSSVSARLEARKIISLAEMEAYRSVAAGVKELLAAKSKDRGWYERYLKRSVERGRALVGERYLLHCNKRDAALARKFGPVSPEPVECEGGVIVSSQDGFVRANCTFEALFSEKEGAVLSLAREHGSRQK